MKVSFNLLYIVFVFTGIFSFASGISTYDEVFKITGSAIFTIMGIHTYLFIIKGDNVV